MQQRFELRRKVGCDVEIISSQWDEPVQMFSGDLSPQGTYIKSQLMPDMGEHLVCSFDLNGPERYCFFGEVTRVNLMRRQNDSSEAGFGVRFMDTTPLERLKIRQMLRGTPPPVPGPRREQMTIL